MKVTKTQALENRTHIVETASTLFRERGYDGVSVADLMAAAGFTHGGFYKHFPSKADLMAEAAACGFSQSTANNADADPATILKEYLSRKHRDALGRGCTLAALSGDAARQPASVKKTFADGIESQLATLERDAAASGQKESGEARARRIAMLAQAVGALVLSRACPDDSALADEILKVCRARILGDHA
ncbi:TetR family transcriptional regulator [Nibricoccus aquaticus]|uniref:TetR family transcriptional regulator n=1 Tax=Nibricoccus aquaticus TaxID=2576891 RepID=A0A290Q583_9BACT|nr:TetR family transcriptional regulator [Nibricoccus aquaticus]ATC63654.1 TetR family transcriptional regulator [Nibricoccus aquaticus]